MLQWAPAGRSWKATQDVARKLGVMFLGTDRGDAPWDIKTTPRDFTDGTSETLLVAENIYTGVSKGGVFSGGRPTSWACPLPTYSMFLASDDVCHSAVSTVDCIGVQLRTTPTGAVGPGWRGANRRSSPEGINGGRSLALEGASPFANSPHKGGANFIFCDAAVRFIKETIDGTVYARLISPADQDLPGSIRPPVDFDLIGKFNNQ